MPLLLGCGGVCEVEGAYAVTKLQDAAVFVAACSCLFLRGTNISGITTADKQRTQLEERSLAQCTHVLAWS